MLNKMTKYRQDLHQIPEIGFDLPKTHNYVKTVLENLGFKIKVYAKTGIVVVKKGKSNDTYAFRADMDALLINEKTNLSFTSKHDGMMHACGHDGHTAMLLGFAEYVSKLKDNYYTIMLIFQPAEEGPGGAKVMINEGIFNNYNIKGIFGLHLAPFLDENIYGLKSGLMLAANAEFDIEIKGKSAHGATPNEGIDTISAASNLINQLNTIVSRFIKPINPAVISVGIIKGGTAKNIISDYTYIAGTIRAFDKETYNLINKKINDICLGIEKSYNVKINYKFKDLYPPVNNDVTLFNLVDKIIKYNNKIYLEPLTFSEDFAFYQQVVPGMFVFIGSKNEKNYHPLHSPYFNFDEKILLNGLELYIKIYEEINKTRR